MHGPPQYFTPNWISSKQSVQMLAALEPALVLTGRGHPLRGLKMRETLHLLADDFDRIAVPKQGRYVGNPAHADKNGLIDVSES